MLLLTLLMTLPFAGKAEAAVVASGSFGADSDNLSWTLHDTGVLTISGTGNMGCIDGKGAANPWSGYFSDITAVIIQPGVTNISDCAFIYCVNMTSISIPHTVTSIGYSAFYDCDNLTRIQIPWGVKSIESSTFGNCDKLIYVGIPSTVTTIGSYAFSHCENLQNVTLPSSITCIEGYAFYRCDKLKNITIPASVTTIKNCAFAGYWSNSSKCIVFLGDCPSISSDAFESLSVTAYYPADNSTWSDDALRKYCASSAYCPSPWKTSFSIITPPGSRQLICTFPLAEKTVTM